MEQTLCFEFRSTVVFALNTASGEQIEKWRKRKEKSITTNCGGQQYTVHMHNHHTDDARIRVNTHILEDLYPLAILRICYGLWHSVRENFVLEGSCCQIRCDTIQTFNDVERRKFKRREQFFPMHTQTLASHTVWEQTYVWIPTQLLFHYFKCRNLRREICEHRPGLQFN